MFKLFAYIALLACSITALADDATIEELQRRLDVAKEQRLKAGPRVRRPVTGSTGAGFVVTSSGLPKRLYIADSGGPVGRIYLNDEGHLSLVYARPKGLVHSIAKSKTGILYFADANGQEIYKLDRNQETSVYLHNTYVRCVRFDQTGRLFFSAASGAKGDGYIYRVNGSGASMVYKVTLSEVDGSWAGDFAFDSRNKLWLSSGNKSSASLYEVDAAHPKRRYTSPGSIMGFSFTRDGRVIWADQRHSLLVARLSDFSIDSTAQFGAVQSLDDVLLDPK